MIFPQSIVPDRPMRRAEVAIANGGSVSSAVEVISSPFRGIAIETPATWTAADVGLQVSHNGTTWIPLRNEDGLVRITGIETAAAGVHVFSAEAWAIRAFRYMRLTSLDSSDETAEAQGDARTVRIYFLE